MSTLSLDLDRALKLAGAITGRAGRYAVPLYRGARLRLPPNPAVPPAGDLAAVREWVRAADRPTAIDLFCGAGGLSLGLEAAGFSVLVGADNDPLAVETHSANLRSLPYLGDLTDPADLLSHLAAWGIESVDLVAGGVPCQPFSRAGRSKLRSLVNSRIRPPDDSRAELWQSFIRVVEELHPRVILLENVPDLAEWDEGAVLVGFCDAIRRIGYNSDATILNAFEHGVPQHRTRLFIVGVRAIEPFQWPAPRAEIPTLWDAIGDLPEVEGGQREDRLPYSEPHTQLQRMLREQVPPADSEFVYDHITRAVRPDDLEAFRLLRPGDTYEDVPEELRRYRADIFTDKYKRLSKDHLSRTITAHIARDGYWYIHPVQHRTLSVREAARIQTFPDWFRFAGEPSHRFRQVGNAVPPLLAEAVGLALQRALSVPQPASHQDRRAQDGADFRTDLLTWHTEHRRGYPWRSGEGGPWQVLLAEICLRRATAAQARAMYDRLVEIAATPSDLLQNRSAAEKLLETLGRRWRTSNIFRIAEILVTTFDGQVPDSRELLLSLPGVGDYVANAVLCFGFRRAAILMDASSERVASRITGRDPSKRRWQMRLDLYRLSGPQGADPNFNSALLDLGAQICRAGTPRCLACPVAQRCSTAPAR